MVEFRLKWPIWDGLYIDRGRLCAPIQPNAVTSEGVWQGEVRDAAIEQSLALELARINRPRKATQAQNSVLSRAKALLGFARQYGPLGQHSRVKVSEFASVYVLDQVQWCLLHAAALDTALTLLGALAMGQTHIVDYQLAAITLAQQQTGTLSLPVGTQIQSSTLRDQPKSMREDRVGQICEQLLNPNLGGVRRLESGNLVVVFASLVNLTHSQVAKWAVDGSFGRCIACLSFFPKSDKRQRYCPALNGQQQSRCAMRDRTRRRRSETPDTKLVDEALSICLLRQDNDPPLALRLNSKKKET